MSALFLIARIAGTAIAIPSNAVESVVDIDTIVPVPLAPAHVRGLSALRSRIVTVIDAALVLGERPACGNRAIVIARDGHDYALLVDGVDDVAPHDAGPVPPALALSPAWRAAAGGLIAGRDDTLLVIDPAALLAAAA